ncbi:MAG: signal recognition particle-docking protein FtsY [Burkholderiales bacterium]|nr:signal recognition particle-docking protein FtsY [Burkholderiales bacterium]
MFSFFKRFKGGKAADTPQDTQAAEATATPAAAPVVSPAQAPTPSVATAAASAASGASAIPAAGAPAPASAAFAAPPQPAPEPFANGSAPSTSTLASATASASADEIETEEIVPPPLVEPAQKQSWLARLRSGLSKTSAGLTGIFVRTKIDDELYEELETALLMADAGVEATQFLLGALHEKVRTQRLTDPQQVKAALRALIVDLLKPLERSLVLGRAQPLVMMIAGVNGAGKTTSIGKLAKHLQRFDQSVLLAAGDTFRAAAREQLAIWGERNNVTVVAQESGDPAAVIFDAVSAARARKIDVVMADTAGRLPTQLHLMEELRKVKRVIGKAFDGAPHEVLLVIDANTGQNALAQVKAFDDALSLTGLIVTKLDGTAKGGILAAIARQRPVPVYFIGVGEKVEDLQPFNAEEFADALLG